MTVELPKLPDRALLADLCRETAARERVQPQLVEKDFYLTRLLWALGQSFGDELLLKGGTLLSKVDLGFFRMSEDADLVLPGPASRQRLTNVRRMHRVRDVLKEIGPVAGVSARFAKWMRRLQRRAGLKETGQLHILRHTFCSRLAMAGASTMAIKELAGHQQISTTQRYMHLSPAAKSAAIRLLDRGADRIAEDLKDTQNRGDTVETVSPSPQMSGNST